MRLVCSKKTHERAIQMGVNPETSSNSKHVDVRYHVLRQFVEKGGLTLACVHLGCQHADFLI